MDRNANNYSNDENLEQIWAFKAFHHADTYFNLISSLDSRILKLSKHDDEIYESFQKEFPDMDVEVVKQEQLKSPESKAKWRPFCNEYQEVVEDYNFGTLLRLDCKGDYSEENTILVTRIQFYAIEIARNKKGLNLPIWKIKTDKSTNENKVETSSS